MTVEFARAPDRSICDGDVCQLVTVEIAGQLFGLPILKVRDVFSVAEMTRVPLAPATVAGLYNLRGRILTILCMRSMLDLPPAPAGAEQIAVGIERQGESFGLLVDKVCEVMSVKAGGIEPNPANLDPRWASQSAGVHRLADRLLIELDLEAMFNDRLAQAA